MTQLVVPNGGQLKIRWTFATYPALNVFGFSGTAAVALTQAIADALFTAIKAGFTSSGMQAVCVDDCVMTGVGIRNVNLANQPEIIATGAIITGTDATGDLVPRQSAVVDTLRTNLVGRSYRGRVFLGGWSETQNNNLGGIASTAAVAADAFVTTVLNALVAQGLHGAVLSKELPSRTNKRGVVLAPKAAFATDIVSHSVRNLFWGSQRGRTHRL